MSDLLTTLVERSLGQAAAVQPRLPSLFEPLTESAGQTHEEFSKTHTEDVAQGHADWRFRDVFQNRDSHPEERPVTAAPMPANPPIERAAQWNEMPPMRSRDETPDRFTHVPADIKSIKPQDTTVPPPALLTDETPAPPLSSSIELEKPAPRAATVLLSGSSRDKTSAHDLTAAIKVESSVTRNRETDPQPIDAPASAAARELTGQPRALARESRMEQRLEPLFKAVSQDREAGPKSEREIRVTIGRIDVRAVHQAQPSAVPARSERPVPRLTLDSYLAQRWKGKR